MTDRSKRDLDDIVLCFVGICAGIACLAWAAGTVVVMVMMIRGTP